LLRSNLNFWNFRGATQLDWSFPLYHQVKEDVQLFTGYGESLFDYNRCHTTIGVGFLLIDWRQAEQLVRNKNRRPATLPASRLFQEGESAVGAAPGKTGFAGLLCVHSITLNS
jgi:hypothetical protein